MLLHLPIACFGSFAVDLLNVLIYYSLFISLPIDGCLDCFQSLMSEAAINSNYYIIITGE